MKTGFGNEGFEGQGPYLSNVNSGRKILKSSAIYSNSMESGESTNQHNISGNSFYPHKPQINSSANGLKKKSTFDNGNSIQNSPYQVNSSFDLDNSKRINQSE